MLKRIHPWQNGPSTKNAKNTKELAINASVGSILYSRFVTLSDKGTTTPMEHIDPVFDLRFWRIWGGVVLYNEDSQMIELLILLQLI